MLESWGVDFLAVPSGAKELTGGMPARQLVLENARLKAQAVSRLHPGEPVLGVDTVVEVDGVIHGQPTDLEAARRMLVSLAGRTHSVHSGACVIDGDGMRDGVETTEVEFIEMDPDAIEAHLALGEWRGRAGAYAIQESGARLVSGLRGDVSNVIGLPRELVLGLLAGLR